MHGVIFDVDMPDLLGEAVTRRNVIKIKPPLVITQEQLDRALDVLGALLKEVEKLEPEQLEGIRQMMRQEAMPR